MAFTYTQLGVITVALLFVALGLVALLLVRTVPTHSHPNIHPNVHPNIHPNIRYRTLYPHRSPWWPGYPGHIGPYYSHIPTPLFVY